MSTKRYKPAQVVNLLRQVEVRVADGKTTPKALPGCGDLRKIYYRWRKEFGGMKLDQGEAVGTKTRARHFFIFLLDKCILAVICRAAKQLKDSSDIYVSVKGIQPRLR